MQAFRANIERDVILPDRIWEELSSMTRSRRLERNQSLVTLGDLYPFEVFVIRGVIRGFYVTQSGEEVNVSFYSDDQVLMPWFLRTVQGRSTIQYQALIETDILEIDARHFEQVRAQWPDLQRWAHAITHRELRVKISRELMLTETAEQRYRRFRTEYPGLETRIAQYHVASYLGISPVSLSRIRSSRSPIDAD